MNPDRAWIAFLLVIVIVVISNALMFAIARGTKGINLSGWKDAWDITRRTYSGDRDGLDELRQRVHSLRKDEAPQDANREDDSP